MAEGNVIKDLTDNALSITAFSFDYFISIGFILNFKIELFCETIINKYIVV